MDDPIRQGGFENIIVVCFSVFTKDYCSCVEPSFQSLVEVYNNEPNTQIVECVGSLRLEGREEYIADVLRTIREKFRTTEGITNYQDSSSAGGGIYLLSEQGIDRIKTHISKSTRRTLPNKKALLEDCERLKKLREQFREAPLMDTIASLTTIHPDWNVGENFLIPKSPLLEISLMYISIITQSKFLETVEESSRLMQDVAYKISESKEEKIPLLKYIENEFKRRIARYQVFGTPTDDPVEGSPARSEVEPAEPVAGDERTKRKREVETRGTPSEEDQKIFNRMKKYLHETTLTPREKTETTHFERPADGKTQKLFSARKRRSKLLVLIEDGTGETYEAWKDSYSYYYTQSTRYNNSPIWKFRK